MPHYRLSFWADFERILLAYCFNLDTTAKYGPYKMYGPYRFGDPVGIRTLDPQLRRLLLYPAELRNPVFCGCKDRKGFFSAKRIKLE